MAPVLIKIEAETAEKLRVALENIRDLNGIESCTLVNSEEGTK